MTVAALEESRYSGYTVEGKKLHTGGNDSCNDCGRSDSTASPPSSILGDVGPLPYMATVSVVNQELFCQNCGYECHCHENEFAGAECGDEWGSSMLKCENDVAVAVMRMNALAQNDSTAHAPNPQIAPLQPEQQRLEGSFDEGFAERFCQKCGYECHCYVNEFAGTECGDEWGTRCPASRRCW